MNNSKLEWAHVKLPDGRIVHLFVNKETSLVVLDIINADDSGGTEVFRRVV